MTTKEEHWDIIIKPKGSKFQLNLKEVWEYKDLLMLYVRRDIVTMYKQTVMGPLWYIIQPLMTTAMYMIVFGGIAGISTDGLPQPLFYMAGIIGWQYFSECLGRASSTFSANAGVFSKVYFPRLVVPYSGLISSFLKVIIQFILFIGIYIYYVMNGVNISPTNFIYFLPILFLMLAFLGMGFGIIISSMTTKYRDLAMFFGFVVQLWMYGTPIIYPLSTVKEKLANYAWVAELNPLTSIIEAMRYALMGTGTFTWESLSYSFGVTVFVMLVGSWMFNSVERKFVDVV